VTLSEAKRRARSRNPERSEGSLGLRRFAGVTLSEANRRARSRNPERSEGSLGLGRGRSLRPIGHLILDASRNAFPRLVVDDAQSELL